MSWFTSLRDSVEKTAEAGVKTITGLSITPALSVGAGGTPSASTAGAAAPSGAVGAGGLPNANPNIFSGLAKMSNQTIMLFVGGALILFLLFRMRR